MGIADMVAPDEVDAALERVAYTSVALTEELRRATEIVTSYATTSKTSSTALPPDTEFAHWLLKLSPRIRRLEMDATQCLTLRLESNLTSLPLVRGLLWLGKAREVEALFARVAILPLVRSRISMGRLDEGGGRGECTGLPGILEDLLETIRDAYGPLLLWSESVELDLLTNGVWVPIASALLNDAGIRMAIFSPGIASILQANYTALNGFLSNLAERLLPLDVPGASEAEFTPRLSLEQVLDAQQRLFSHPKTEEFSKKWNLPIYYQLRFGEACTRLNKAIDQTQKEGWIAQVYSGQQLQSLKEMGLEVPLFQELYEILLSMWLPDVILQPLTNRFLRGSIQLVGRVISFIEEGLEGTVQFGEEPKTAPDENGASEEAKKEETPYPTRAPYCWAESEEDVAAVAWELTVLESAIQHDYTETICKAIGSDDPEVRSIVEELLTEASLRIDPIIEKAWNDIIVGILTKKCTAPLAAVKGVAATYRMTNRPPPSRASPFVATILRPLKEFDSHFRGRTPDKIGAKWKHAIVVSVADHYAASVEELIATVQRTEEALRNRARRTNAGGMSDGEKVKLQLYLDYETFTQNVSAVGVDPVSVIGITKLGDLTAEGAKLQSARHQNGN